MSSSTKKVAIIGGGITGLSAAYFLNKRTDLFCSPVLLEKESRLGGQIQTETHDSFLIEAGPESFVYYKPAVLELCQELGIQEELLEPNSEFAKTFMLHQGRLVEMPAGVFSPFSQSLIGLLRGFMSTPLLSRQAKLRMAAEFFIPKRNADIDIDEPLGQFIERRFGREFFEVLLSPLLAGVYGGEPALLSAKTVLREYCEAEQNYGSVLRALFKKKHKPQTFGSNKQPKSVFVTLRSGLSRLVRKLSDSLPEDCIYSNAAVEEISQGQEKYTVKLADGRSFEVNAMILTTPAYVTANLLKKLNANLANSLSRIPYSSSSVLTFGFRRENLRRDLKGFGFLVSPSENLCFTACTWSSSKWQGRADAERTLLRLYIPGFHENQESLSKQALKELTPILGINNQPILERVHPHPDSLPQYIVNHRENVSEIFKLVSSHPGLFLAGAPYHGVGIPDCIESGKTASSALLAYLQGIKPLRKEPI